MMRATLFPFLFVLVLIFVMKIFRERASHPLLELSRTATYVKYPYLEFHKYRELVRQL